MEYVLSTFDFFSTVFALVGLSQVLFVAFIIAAWYFMWSVFSRFL